MTGRWWYTGISVYDRGDGESGGDGNVVTACMAALVWGGRREGGKDASCGREGG